jgi:hypothetical protein
MGCNVNSHKGANKHRAKEPYIFIHKLVTFHLLFHNQKNIRVGNCQPRKTVCRKTTSKLN